MIDGPLFLAFAALAVVGGLMAAVATYHALALFGGWRRRRSGIERRDDEKKAARRSASQSRRGAAEDSSRVSCRLDLAAEELPPDVRRQFDEQDAEIFRGGNKQVALNQAEAR